MNLCLKRCGLSLTLAVVSAGWLPAAQHNSSQKKESPYAQVSLQMAHEGCKVDIDATPAGVTDAKGNLQLDEVEPTDHYIHVQCPAADEMTFFISPHAGESVEIQPGSASSTAGAPTGTPLEAAEAKARLRQLIQDAVRLRARGQLDKAVQGLHDAAKLDPANSDLHRELGITFLLVKEWKRAEVEMLEAIRQDPSDADAHNGLGYALEKQGRLDDALKQYRVATQLDPDDPSYRQHYVDALSKYAGRQSEKKK